MHSIVKNLKLVTYWYLSAIEIIDTQVARRGRQYHRNPPPYKNRPTKKNRIYKIKNPHHTATTTAAAAQPNTPNTTTATQPNPTHPTPKPNNTTKPNPTQPN